MRTNNTSFSESIPSSKEKREVGKESKKTEDQETLLNGVQEPKNKSQKN